MLGASLLTIACTSSPSLDDDLGSESEESEESESETDGTETETNPDATCQEFCTVQNQCDPDRWYTFEDCLDTCADEFEAAAATDECLPVLDEFYTCVAELTCEQFDVLFDDPENPCWDEVLAFDEICADALSCELSGGGDEQGSYCTYQYECYASGLHRVECYEDTGCTCLLKGVEVGSCDALYPSLCEPLMPENPNEANTQILDRMNECCGWALEI
jgi:hypothetical protein